MKEKTLLKVFVKPNARKRAYKWLDAEILKIDIDAPPENNKANNALIEYFSELLDIPQSDIEIKGGGASKHKFILINISLDTIKNKLV